MHRFFVSTPVAQDEIMELPQAVAHQVRSVLRMRPGEHIALLDGSGWEYEVELTALTRDQATGQVVGWKQVTGEAAVWITLYPALLKKDNFELVLQKGTELGVSAFVPLETERTIVKLEGELKPNKANRWERILTESVEQSGRGRVPELYPPAKLADALPQLPGHDLSLAFSTGGGGYSLRSIFGGLGYVPRSVALLVGPEGGFSPEEVAMLTQAGAYPVTLGPRVLRAETAAVVAAALVMESCGQLGDLTAPAS